MTHRAALLFTAMMGGWCLVGFICVGIAAWFTDSGWGHVPLIAWIFLTCLYAFYCLARASGEKR